jgi:DNA-binding NtrC family response regulator
MPRPCMVLIVEDEKLVADTCKWSLEDRGAIVEVSGTGSHAMELMERKRFDSSLIDAILPDMTGFQVAAHAADLRIPVLITSGHPDATLLCQTYGFSFLPKPFSLDALVTQTFALIGQAEQNVALLAASCAALRDTVGDWRHVMIEARRLVQESAASRQRNAEIKYTPLGQSSATGGAR